MDDTYIQNIANIDQPAELEGIRLNWGPSRFVKTSIGPRDLRTAPATQEFWDIWKRNKEALKAAGISCFRYARKDWCVTWWIDVSGDVTSVDDIQIPEDESDILSSDYITPVDSIQIPEVDGIHIPEGESYTLSEVIDFVKQVLDKVSEQSEHSKLQYSSTDVYWLLHDMLQYANRNVPGMFVIRQIQKGIYRVKYMFRDFARQRSGRKLKAEVNRTASYLEELTGRRPSWGEEE